MDLTNSRIDFPFTFTNKNLGKSLHHQLYYGGTYQDYVKAMSCFDEIVENAIPIETHNDKKSGTTKAENDLKQVYVLVSAFTDGETISPVQLEIKEYEYRRQKLYLTVMLTKITPGVVENGLAADGSSVHSLFPGVTAESEVMEAPAARNAGVTAPLFSGTAADSEVVEAPGVRNAKVPAPLFPESTISLRALIENVNSNDYKFIKYVPDGFLNEEQKAAKQRALAEQEREYESYSQMSLRDGVEDIKRSQRAPAYSYASATDADFHRNGKIYNYDFGVAQQPISVIVIPSVDTLMNNGRFSRSEVVEKGKDKIPGTANEKGHKKVRNVYTGRVLTITNNSIRHGLNGDKQRLIANAQVGLVIGDVVKNGIPVNGLTPTDGNALQTYAMATPCVTEDGKRMKAVTHVDIQNNEMNSVSFTDIVHSTNGRIYKNSEPVSNTIDVEGQGPYHPSRYTICIADMLKDVNLSFKSLLSQNVLNHLGEERPANGAYSNKVLYSLRDGVEDVRLRETDQRHIPHALTKLLDYVRPEAP